MSGYQPFQPVTLPDYGQTLARMAQIDAQRQQIEIARQGQKQEQAFNQGLATLAPALASGQGPEYSGALATLAGLGPRGMQMALPMLQQDRQRQEAADFWRTGGMGGAAPVAPAGGDYVTRTVAVENNPNRPDYTPDARNPRSSATGDGQFIDGTWMEFAAANPQRFQGMTRDQILAARADPALSREAIGWYRDRNLRELQAQGLPANDTTAALAHRFGPEGAVRLLRSDPNAPIGQVVGAQVMAANPDLAGRTVGQVMGQYAQRFGGGAPASAPPAGGLNPAEMALIERGLSHPNPQVQQAARARLEVLRMRQQNNPETYREETRTIGGRQVAGQVNSRTGQFTAYPGQTERPESLTPANALATVRRIGPRIAAGEVTPNSPEYDDYVIAYQVATRPQPVWQDDPNQPGVQRQILQPGISLDPGRFPPPQGGAYGGGAGAAPAAPGAAPAAAPQAGNADAVPVPTDPPTRRTDGPSTGDRSRLRAIETDAQGILDALDSFRQERRNSNLLTRGFTALGVPTNLATAWTNAALMAKGEALYNLGVLNGPDLTIIQRALSDPSTMRGFFTGDDVAEAQIRSIENLIRQRVATARQQFGGQPAAQSPGPGGVGTAEPPSSNAAPVRVRTPEEARRLPSGTRIILPDGSEGRVP